MFDRFTEPAEQVMWLASREADRLRHDYVGPEHVLAALARQPGSRASAVLRRSGLGAEAVGTGLDRLVAAGTLPGPERSKADLLRTVGIDLGAVQQAVGESFGDEAVCEASRRAARRSRLRRDRLVSRNPLSDKALLAKRAFELAGQEADALGQRSIRPEHVLLGVLRDARDPAGSTRPGRRARRERAQLGLPPRGPSPVMLIVEAARTSPDALRSEILSELRTET